MRKVNSSADPFQPADVLVCSGRDHSVPKQSLSGATKPGSLNLISSPGMSLTSGLNVNKIPTGASGADGVNTTSDEPKNRTEGDSVIEPCLAGIGPECASVANVKFGLLLEIVRGGSTIPSASDNLSPNLYLGGNWNPSRNITDTVSAGQSFDQVAMNRTV